MSNAANKQKRLTMEGFLIWGSDGQLMMFGEG